MSKEKHILIITFAYPPNPIIGARRISKISKHLFNNGWIPHIISAKNNNHNHKAPIEIPKKYVHELIWDDIWLKIDKIKNNFIKKILKKIIFPYASSRRLKKWRNVAVNKSLEIIKKHNIEIIYSTFSPKENIIIANILKKKTNIIWINEYRDLWIGNPYHKRMFINHLITKIQEKKLLKPVDAIVTVSEPLKQDLIKLHNKDTHVIYNGFDNVITNFNINNNKNDSLNILYTGTIYNNKRDPYLLFKALKIIKEDDVNFYKKINVKFYGPNIPNILGSMVKKFNVQECVKLFDTISHNKVIELQKDTDVLLLLGWNNIKEKGVVTGKLFEYIGRLKVILAITYPDGAVASILDKTKLGNVWTDSNEIATYLYKIHQNKKIKTPLNKESILFYSREYQTNKLINIFDKLNS
ncbi:MAG: glycosyltransferase [Flavobacteriaceae bacterium]|nr:glycosyltransferase [Flavobacteriaceae bacterium]